jgi:aspartate aminotransferase-like enzyme
LVYHRRKEFGEIFNRVRRSLKEVVATSGEIYIFGASGTGAMEAAVVNLLSPGEPVLVAVGGRFGERWLDLCKCFGARPEYLSVPYGESVPAAAIEQTLKSHPDITSVFTTLTETSTGALMDIKAIGAVTRKLDRLLIVDAVAGLAADECYMDDWQVDVLVGASQKALMAPPGVSFVAVNERGWQRAETARMPRFYFDLKACKKYAADGQTPWTPPINVVVALDVSLGRIVKSGMAAMYAHHRGLAQLAQEGVRKLGLSLFPKFPSCGLTVAAIPEGYDATKIVASVLEKDHLLLANGQGEMRGRIVRIGHMGAYTRQDMLMVIKAFASGCESIGLEVKKEEAVESLRKKL